MRRRWRTSLKAVFDTAAKVAAGLVLTGSLQNGAFANPQGGTVVEGAATIEQTGNQVNIHQATDSAIIDWRSFSIAPGETTRFHQPSASSIALNRVTGADPSAIFGTLSANGRVFLVNPNGIMFGVGSRVDVSGLVATTSDIRNDDFMAGRMEFSIPSSNPNASVVNQGTITIADAGYAALVAPHVRNSGVINARLGRVTLGAADSFAVDLYGDELVAFRVGVSQTPLDENGDPVESLVANNGQILAGGGIVQLAASNVEAVVRNVINTDGVIYANTLERQNGKIILKATGPGALVVSGDLSATEGSVDISGDGDVTLTGAKVAAASVGITGDADLSGAGDLNEAPTGGDVVVTDSEITAKDADGTGGSVAITADRVALTGSTNIDASGAAGGGDVLIGGAFQGKGALRNAEATIVGSDVTIEANAVAAGDGGQVILWADGYTRFHGAISARGGVTAGDGGFVEVSGKQNLDFSGTADLTAQSGEVGTLLLDPVDIVVSSDNTDGSTGSSLGNILFADAPGLNPWNVSAAALEAVGGNVLLQATNDITISETINLTTAGATFTATANNDINVNESITTNNGAITLSADADSSGAGDVTVSVGKAVTTGGAALQISANDLALSGTLNSGAGDATILVSDGGTILLGGGGFENMTISATELQNITAANLTIGDATNGNITVKNIGAANSNNIAGIVTLNATKAGSTVDFSGSGGTFNALTINADAAVDINQVLVTDTGGLTVNSANGVTISEDVTSAGATVIDADSDNNGTGNFTVAATKSLNTGGNTLSITANDMTLTGTLNSGAAATTLLVSDGGTIGLGATAGDMSLSGAELQNITATGLTIGDSTSGNIIVDGITAGNSNNITGTVTLNATQDNAAITFQNTASTFNALTASADDGIGINVALSTDTGNLVLDGDADNAADTNDNITFAAGTILTSAGALTLDATTSGVASGGGLTLNAANGVTINDNLTTAGATIIDTDTDNNGTGDFTIAAAKVLTTTGGTLSITANDLTLTGTLNSGAAATTLLVSDGGTIGLGATAGDMTISGAELQNITATGLTIGDATSGAITIDGITAANSNNIFGTTTLNATNNGASITFQNTASTFNALTASADNGIAVNANVTADTGNLMLEGDADNAADGSDNITFAAGTILTSAGALELNATTGGMTGAGALTLDAAWNVWLRDSLTTAGITTIDADSNADGNGNFRVFGASAFQTTNNALSITANDVIIAGTVSSGSAATTLIVSDGGTIGLGATAGDMSISGAELQNITATGLTIGDATNGTITIDGITAANSQNITGTVTLKATNAAADIQFDNTASTFNALTANAGNEIKVNVALTTDTGGLTVTAGDDVAFNENVTTAGAVIIDADSDNSGAGDFSVAASKALVTNNNTLSITANDMDITGTLNSGGAATTLLVSDAGTIGLGASGGDMTISGAELQNITATGLTIGDATNGNMIVDGITAANSNNVSGTLTLNATRNGASLSFLNTASVFNALTVNADDQISVNANVTTDTGNLSLDGDADNAADTNDNIAFAAGVILTAAGSLSLDATTGNMAGAGALTLNANNGLTLSASYVGAGITNMDADADGNSSGNFSATSMNVGANNLTVSGVSVNTGTSLTAGTTTLNGAVTGSGLTVAALTLTGASAALTGTTVGGQTGNSAAIATTMADAATHLVNGFQKGGNTPPPTEPPPEDLDSVVVDPGGSGGTGGPPGGSGGGDSGGAGGGDTGGDSGGDTGGDTGGDSGADTGGDTSGDTSGETGGDAGGDTSGDTGGDSGGDTGGDSGGGAGTTEVGGGDWSDNSFNPASGDILLTGSAGAFQQFFEMLKEEGAEALDLLEASENLGNPDVASLVEALSEILGEYDLVSTSIPTNAFNDKAQILLPGLLTFEPVAAGGSNSSANIRRYAPPSFGRFQF